LTQPYTTLSAASATGATNIKVASVAGFNAGQTIRIDAGANLETAVVATVGSAGATTARNATDVGATVIPVASAIGFSEGETITVGDGGSSETAIVASITRFGGSAINVAAPLTHAHAIGAQVSGTGVTLDAALTRAHASEVLVAGGPSTPGAPNQSYKRAH
jgi:hypothetical protein